MVILRMLSLRQLTIATLAVLLAHSAHGQSYQGKELVKASLQADTAAIVPGKPFNVGLLLRMAPGWHTYWKFSGDAGLPTEIKWNLPPGWKVGEIQWPIPLKTLDPGDIQTYGYQDEIMLIQQVTPPDKIDNSAVKLSAQADWLVCEKICIPGSAKLELELPTSTTAEPKNTDLFARYRRLVPKEFPGNDAKSNWSRTGNDLHLKVTSDQIANYQNLDFFPLPQGNNVVVGHPTVESREGSEVTFKIPTESLDKNSSSMPGVIVYSKFPNGNDRSGWEISAPQIATATPQIAQPTRGLATFLLFGFIGGFILNLMPCVLPVISLKIFGFIQQSGESRAKIFRSGLAFVAGIFTWFVGLALVLIAIKAAGHDVTWASQFTNPYFVLLLSVIVLVFALNLFGVFEITLPQFVSRGMESAPRKGNAGSFFQGVFATALATPCTAPFLGTAIGFAFTQSSAVILSMFVAVAAGMSAPYFLLSAQPAWMKFLPQPGTWMVHVKQFMGFLLIATLLFLIYVLGAQRGLEGAIWASCFLLVIAIACWMKGAFMLPTASATKRTVTLLLILVIVLASGFYFIGDKFQSSKIDIAQSASGGGWQAFTPERLQSERDAGHAVFVDFTAAWCLTCKFNEKAVLENSEVRDAFQRHNVVKIKADWTNGDPAITKLLQQFGRPGVPLYVLYPGKSAEPIVFPELLTKNILLDKLETIAVASR
jgi:thiol:disulfide interchange protein/DsbC/DsbD-like thiol-disulfide interchange protein